MLPAPPAVATLTAHRRHTACLRPQASERWSPVQSVEKILLSVLSMLAEPNDESGANIDASKMWREDRDRFNTITEQVVQNTLGLLIK